MTTTGGGGSPYIHNLMIDLELIDLVEELYCCCDYFETYFMLLDLFLFLDFWDLFCAFGFILVVEFIYFETYFILLDFIL